MLTASPPDTRISSRFYLAPVAGVGWLAGIWLASALTWDGRVFLLWAAMAVPAAVVLWRRGRAGLILAGCCAVGLGGARYMAAQPPTDAGRIHAHNGTRDVVVWGEVNAEPRLEDTRAQLLIETRRLQADGQTREVTGVLQANTGRFPAIAYGTSVRLSGDLLAPEALGSPDYAAYLHRKGIHSVMRYPELIVLSEGGGSAAMRVLLRLKERGREVIRTILPEPQAALLTGILLGDSSGMPDSLDRAFRETGMTHIIAISGFNIALIIALLDRLSRPVLPRRAAGLLIMGFIGLYAVLVGAGASVIRAALMGAAYLASLRLLGRPALALSGLFCAAILMTLADPNLLWDIGFQLSFMATLGLMLYAGRWTRRLEQGASAILAPETRRPVTRLLAEGTVVTLAAQILTLPLILFHFGRLSLASLPANLLVLPAQPGVMVAGGVALLAGLILPVAGRPAGAVAWVFLSYTVFMVRLLARLPAASVPLSLSPGGLVAVYAAIGALTFLAAMNPDRREAWRGRLRAGRRSAVALAGAGFGLFLLAAWFAGRPDGRLHVAFFDVGQGDAVFITTPAGRQVLIDGGRYPSMLLDELGRQMPFWDRTLDLVIATHPDADHVAGLVSVVERYRVSRLMTNGADAASDEAFAALLAAAEGRETTVHPARRGESIVLDDGLRLDILHASAGDMAAERNDASLVGRLEYRELSLLLTGDAEEAAETALLRSGQTLDSVVMKAGHHGANTSSSAPFLQAVSPQVIVISVGRENRYGHPHPDMLARAAAAGAMVLRTDMLGTIELVTDGRRMWWDTAQDPPAPLLPGQ